MNGGEKADWLILAVYSGVGGCERVSGVMFLSI